MYRLNTEKRFGLRADTFPTVNLDVPVSEDALATASIGWITAAADAQRFQFYGNGSLKCLEDIKKCNSKDCSTAEKLRALKRFATLFVNNPYCCENECYDKGIDRIVSDYIVCFFVECMGVCVPAGVLRDCFGVDLRVVLSRFLHAKNSAFTADLKATLEKCRAVSSAGVSAFNRLKRIIWPTIILTILLCISICLGYNGFIKGIDWQNLSAVFSSGAGFVRTIGLMTKHSHALNPDSTLPILILINSLIGLGVAIVLLKPVFVCIRAFIIYNYLIFGKNNCEDTANCIQELVDAYQSRNAYISYNMERLPLMRLDLKESKTGQDIIGIFSGRRSSVNMPKGIASIPRTKTVVLLSVLVLVLCLFGALSENDAFVDRYHMCSLKCSEYIDSKKLRGCELFYVTNETQVYTSDDAGAMPVCTLTPDKFFEILEKSENGENLCRIRFKTDVGIVSGWIKDASLNEVNPFEQMLLEKLVPYEVISSGGNEKIQRLTDESKYTAWRAQNADGEIRIDFNYQQAVDAKILMFHIGNFLTNWYTAKDDDTVSFDVEFSHRGTSLGKISAELSEKTGDQFIHLNKSVTVDKVSFIVTGVTGDGKSNNPYIAELGVYNEKQE